MMITKDIRHNIYSPRLFARKIWGMLYPTFISKCPNPTIHEWDSFLCDLYTFAAFIEKQKFIFYWQVSDRGWTDTLEHNNHSGEQYQITVTERDKIVIKGPGEYET